MSINKIVCLGDSLTEGFDLDEKQRWTSLLNEKFSTEFINKGISGDTTAGMLARFQSMVVDSKPEYVIIFGGTNDVSLGIKKNIILGNLLAMIKIALYYGITPILGIPTSTYCEEKNNTRNKELYLPSKKMDKRIKKLQKFILEFAIDRDLQFINFSKYLNSSDYTEDGIHHNANGHQKMMKNVEEALNKLLKNKQQ